MAHEEKTAERAYPLKLLRWSKYGLPLSLAVSVAVLVLLQKPFEIMVRIAIGFIYFLTILLFLFLGRREALWYWIPFILLILFGVRDERLFTLSIISGFFVGYFLSALLFNTSLKKIGGAAST